jgi:antitoxin component of MazEF toxin-antitoxin module
MSMDQLLAAAIEANPDAIVVNEDPPADGVAPITAPPAVDPAAAPVVEPPKDAEPDVSAVRARAMLAAAKETERAAEEKVANATASFATRLRSNPKALLAELGLSIDDVIDASIAEGAVAAPQKPSEVDELRKRLDDMQNARDQERLDTAIANTKAAVAADARFPTVNAKGHQQLVVDFMIEYHAQHGKPITWDKAAALIEADLAPPKAPAPKTQPNVAVPTPARPGTTTLTAKDSSNYVPPAGELPEDPDKLLKFLVAGLPADNS